MGRNLDSTGDIMQWILYFLIFLIGSLVGAWMAGRYLKNLRQQYEDEEVRLHFEEPPD